MSDQIIIDLEQVIPDFLVGEIRAKLAYIDETIRTVDVTADGQIVLGLAGPADPEHELKVRGRVNRVVDTLVENSRRPDSKIFEDHSKLPTAYRDDPMPELLRQRHVIQEGLGSFTLGPRMTHLVNYFATKFGEFARSSGAAPYRFPAVIPADFLERISYFRNFPHSLSFVTHLREDMDIIDAFAKTVVCEGDELVFPSDSLAKIQSLLSPTVCHHLYLALAGSQMETDLYAATAENHCCRYESINMTSLERLWNFTMWEVIFVGTAERVIDGITRASEMTSALFQEIGLAFHIENANDPFFLEEFSIQAAYQQAYDLKHEFRVLLPYKDGTLAAGSRNYHQDFFGRRADISLPDGNPVHTGCVGFGFERLAFAFVAQYGPHPKQWPAMVRNSIPENA